MIILWGVAGFPVTLPQLRMENIFNSPVSCVSSGCLESCVGKDFEAISRYNRRVINSYQINYRNQSWVWEGKALLF